MTSDSKSKLEEQGRKSEEEAYRTGIRFALDWDFFCRDFYKSVVQNASSFMNTAERRAFMQGAGVAPPYTGSKPNDHERTMYYGILHRTLAMIANGKIRGCEFGNLFLLINLFQTEANWEHYYGIEKASGLWNRFEESLNSDDKELAKTALSALSLLTPLVIADNYATDFTEAMETWYYTTQVFEKLYERVRENGFCWPEGREIVKYLEKEAIELFATVISSELYKLGDGDFDYFPVKNLLAMLCCVNENESLERNFKENLPDGEQDKDMLTPLKKTLATALVNVIRNAPRFYKGGPDEYVTIFKADRMLDFLRDGAREEVALTCIRDGYAPVLFYSGAMDLDEFFKLVGSIPEEWGQKKIRGRIYRGLSLREGEDDFASFMEKEFFARMEEHAKDNASNAQVLKKHLSLVKDGVVDMFRAPVKEAGNEDIVSDAYAKYLKALSLSLEKHRERDAGEIGEAQLMEVSF